MADKPVDIWRPWRLMTREQVEASPSFIAGMGKKREKQTFRTCISVIRDAGIRLKQNMEVIATAQMYFTRFFAIKSFQSNSPYPIAVACLFVACKTEMRPRFLQHVMQCSWYAWVEKWIKGQQKKNKDPKKGAEYWRRLTSSEACKVTHDKAFNAKLYETVCSAERCLLYTTNFQFNIMTAFHALVAAENRLKQKKHPQLVAFFEKIKALEEKWEVAKDSSRSFLQIVWNFVITIYDATRLCLQYDPRTIGVACYETVCRMQNVEIPTVDGQSCWTYVAMEEDFNWDLNVMNPTTIREIQVELSALYLASDGGVSENFAFLYQDGQVANDATVNTNPAPATLIPAASPTDVPFSGVSPADTFSRLASEPSPGQASSQTQDERLGGQNNASWPAGLSPPPLPDDGRPLAAPLPPSDPPTSGHSIRQPSSVLTPPLAQEAPSERPKREREAPSPTPQEQDAQREAKRSKLDNGFNFEPSDEFSISPPREPEAAPQGLQTLESKESGELLIDDEPKQAVKPDPEVLKARLAKARALAGKMAPSTAKQPDSPAKHVASFDDDLDVHFSP